jgi:hypothetical protein
MDIKAEAILEDTDRGTKWGNAGPTCISPPEEEYLIAEVKIKIDLNQLKSLVHGLEEGFETTITDAGFDFDTETGELFVELTLEGSMIIGRTGGLYERPIR